MKPSTRLALLLSLVVGLGLGYTSPAFADHEVGHDHPFCAQGGGTLSDGGEGGTIPPEGALTETNNAPVPDGTVLIPRHLGARFGEDDPRGLDPDAQFIEIDADDLGDTAGAGNSAGPFHGGHGGGPGGGQGGSTFFGAGDGGCSAIPEFIPTRREGPPGRRLPITGSFTEQFGLMGALFVSLGATLWMAGRRRTALASAGDTPVAAIPTTTALPRRSQQVVSRLKSQVRGPWVSRGDVKG